MYKGKTISTPFILPRKDYKSASPTDYDQFRLLSNLVAFHVGMKGTLTPRHIQYQLKLSYANHYIKDVETAKKNNVHGFITKPYSKNKIHTAINQYIAIQAKW